MVAGVGQVPGMNTGQTKPNLVVVRLAADGSISLYNAAGSTDVVIDVVGYYSG